MSDAANQNPREAAIELFKSIREELESAKLPVPPSGPIHAVVIAITEAIAEHRQELAKMQTLEVTALKKNVYPATVFDILKKGQDAHDGEDVIDLNNANDPEKRLKDGTAPGAVVPSKKKSKKIPAEGSGGEVEKDEMEAGEPVEKDLAGATASLKLQNQKLDAANVARAPKFGGGSVLNTKKGAISAGEQEAIDNPGTPAGPMMKSGGLKSPILTKALARLGGKDQASQQMTQHAHAAAPKAPVAPVAPKAPVAPVKPPNMSEHHARHDMLASFTPPGKFTKKEFDGEKCPYCKQSMSKCSCA